MEYGVQRELLRAFGGRLKSDYDFEEVPLTKTMLKQLARLHDAELSMVVHRRERLPRTATAR